MTEPAGPPSLAKALKALLRLLGGLDLKTCASVLALHLLAVGDAVVGELTEGAVPALVAGAEEALLGLQGSLDLAAGAPILALLLLAVRAAGGVVLTQGAVVVLMTGAVGFPFRVEATRAPVVARIGTAQRGTRGATEAEKDDQKKQGAVHCLQSRKVVAEV